ncbi:MAG: hypothetical protein C0598_12215 [Marinilabiliales bacterium]|nr:MAG: hypothetical protein C0598_12215 [Marinilabiliales bacterium]
MDYQQLSVIIIATFIGLLYLLKIRSLDFYEKEPFFKLLIVSILGGISSVIVSLIFYEFVEVQYNFLDAIIKIGFIEELSKLLTLIILVNYFNEISDGIIYITAISLGFAIIENIFYSFGANNSLTLLFQRSLFSVLGHISFSGYMGLAYYIHRKVHKNYLGILLSLIIASVAHGLYDGVLFEEELNITFNVVFILLIILQYRLFKIILGFSKFRKSMSKDLFINSGNSMHLYCCQCDINVKSDEYEFNEIKIGYCNSCNNVLVNADNFIKILKYYRPVLKYKKYLKNINKSETISFLDDDKKVGINAKRAYVSSNIDDLSNWLIISNDNDEKKILQIPLLGYLIKMLGIRYIRA